MSLKIKKRNGSEVSFAPQKIHTRIKKASKGLNINSDEIFIKVITSVPTEGTITTVELDKLICEISAAYTGSHYDYSKFAAHIAITSFHKETNESFYETMESLNSVGIINDEFMKKMASFGKEVIDSLILTENDFRFDYFAWRTLKEMYLLKTPEGIVVERPQFMYLRVAVWLNDTIEDIKSYYESLSNHLISPATPIMINSGTKESQLASCVLYYNEGDSREGLLSTLGDISTESANASGIGLCMSNIRSKESRLSSSGGYAGGLLKYLKIVNESLRFFNQQGRRAGSAAIYIEPWHKDVFDLLDIKKNTGAEEMRARDLFTALWVSDNFMEAVRDDADWYLFCPNDIKKSGLKALDECHGDEFVEQYNKAINLNIGTKIKAQTLWNKIVSSQIETGVPYLLAKDSCNRKSNQKNLGTIKSSNLCAEIIQFSNPTITAICSLSSLILKNFVTNKTFDFDTLYLETKKVVRAINKVININHYSTNKGRMGGYSQRAIAIGVQGLADTFFAMDFVFTSDEAKKLNKEIFETIYFAALEESKDLVKSGKYCKYSAFDGSPLSEGTLQFDFWGVESSELSQRWDWENLRLEIAKYGVANSLLTGAMPTASSAKITSSYESFEPAHSALFNRRVVGGEILVVNKNLIADFEEIGIWSEQFKNDIIMNEGSIQNINFENYIDADSKKYSYIVERVNHLVQKYKTIWEISQRELINMAADRAPFIDQSQSMNIYMADPTLPKISSAHFHAWAKGLKTICYYVRTRAISTGAKHLAINVSETTKEPKVEKPKDSLFECFGCSS